MNTASTLREFDTYSAAKDRANVVGISKGSKGAICGAEGGTLHCGFLGWQRIAWRLERVTCTFVCVEDSRSTAHA